MTSNSSQNGIFFTMPNHIGMPVGNCIMPVWGFQVPDQQMHSIPAQVQQPSLISSQPIPNQDMDVCELAAWVKEFGQSIGWEEADDYAESFRQNGIDGRKLLELSKNDLHYLEVDLKIAKLGHRLEILQVSKNLRMHNQVRIYSDSENTVSSIDCSHMFAPVPRCRSGGKYGRNTQKYDRESDRTNWSYSDREDYTPISSPGFGGAPVPCTIARWPKPGQRNPEEKAFIDTTSHEPLVSNGVGANDIQRPKTNVATEMDNSRETASPYIDFNIEPEPEEGTRSRPTRCRVSEDIMPLGQEPGRSDPLSSETPSDEDSEC